MPAGTALSKIGRFEFFAILAPGLCLIAIVTLFLTAWINSPRQDSFEALNKLSNLIKAHWPLSIVLFFFSYLLGNILRAIPVNIIDRICGRIFKKTARSYHDCALYKENFPYLPMLRQQLDDLQANGLFKRSGLPNLSSAHTIFNLWKMILCYRAPATFDYLQDLEGRVRLFSGIIWSALLSSFIAAIGAILSICPKHPLNSSWLPIMIIIAFVSLLLAVLLGWRLRHVRGEEVYGVYHAVVSLMAEPHDINSATWGLFPRL
jgi:hypothetical protein